MRPSEGLVVDRRAFMGTVAGTLLAAPLAAEAQHAGKMWRVGWLALGSAASAAPYMDGFRVALRELRRVECQSFVLDIALGEGRADRLPVLVAQLLNHKVDVIIAGGGNATVVAAKAAAEAVPVGM